MRRGWSGWLATAAILLLPVVPLLPHLGGFIYQAGSNYNDLAISHFPYALWQQRSLLAGEGVLLWAPGIESGIPATANPLSGLHYPFGWLALLFPLPFGLNLLAVFHIVFAGWGMFLFLRDEGLDARVALFGGLAFEAMPKYFAHLAAGHLTLVYAVAWTPWLLLAQRATVREMHRRWMAPGLALGLIFLADPRYAALAGCLWLVSLLHQLWLAWKAGEQRAGQRAVFHGLSTLGVAAGVGALLWLPLVEFMPLSTRSLMTPQDALILSLPPIQLIGLLAPGLGGTHEWVLYPGAAVFALDLVALALPVSRRKGLFWAILAGLALLWSLGEYFPLARFLVRLPGFSLLRVPPRMMFVGLFSLIVLACLGLQALLDQPEGLRRLPKLYPFPVLAGLVVLLLLVATAVSIYGDPFPWQLLWGAVALLGAVVGLHWLRAERVSPARFILALTAWMLADLIGADRLWLAFRPADEVLAEQQVVATEIVARSDGQPSRVYSPSYSIPQQTAAEQGLELADGVDPLQLSAYSQFMVAASGVPAQGYQVTIPPLENGDPAEDNRAYVPDAVRLGWLNVRYVAAEYPLESSQLEALGRYGTTYLYQNQAAQPRAWVQAVGGALGENARPVTGLQSRSNEVDVRATGPGLLVLAEIAYPGWKVRIDGGPATLQTVEGLLRGVDLPAGEHTAQFVFRPTTFYAGALIGGLTWLLCGGWWLRFCGGRHVG